MANSPMSYDYFAAEKTFTATNGTVIKRRGCIAEITKYGKVTTTAQSAIVDTITDESFYPIADLIITTKVFNGSSYVDCQLGLVAVDHIINITDLYGHPINGAQSQYLKTFGVTYICKGDV